MTQTASFPPRLRFPSVVSGQYVRHWYDVLVFQSEAYHITPPPKKSSVYDCTVEDVE